MRRNALEDTRQGHKSIEIRTRSMPMCRRPRLCELPRTPFGRSSENVYHKGVGRDVQAEAQRLPGSSSPLSKSSSMCSLAACTSSELTRISSISIWLQLRRTYSSSSASLRLAPAFRRWMMYCRTLCLRSASGPSPVPPINVSQNDPCSATATHSSCYPYRTPQSHTRIFASDNGRYSPTSWNAVKRKSNFGEYPSTHFGE